MDEREFSSMAIVWTTQWLAAHPAAVLGEPRSESPQFVGNSRKRRDLSLLSKGPVRRPIFSCELKVPENRREGGSPDNEILLKDAHGKAVNLGLRYFGTWNVRDFSVWTTDKPIGSPPIKTFSLAPIGRSDELMNANTEAAVRAGWWSVLDYLDDLLRPHVVVTRRRPLTTAEVIVLRDLVDYVADAVQPTLFSRVVGDAAFRRRLLSYTATDFGWTLKLDIDESTTLNMELRQIARLAAFVQVNKLLFYELLRANGPKLVPVGKRFTLDDLSVDAKSTSPRRIGDGFHAFYGHAVSRSGDYETVFTKTFADDIVFVEPAGGGSVADAGSVWSEVIDRIQGLDLEQLPRGAIHDLYEEVIDEEMRHELGQFYTPDDVVDLINAYAIKTARDLVLDTSTGGGSFLLSAYDRKRQLDPAMSHGDTLSGLYGTEITDFAGHLATVALASRNVRGLVSYPRIVPADFFTVFPGKVTKLSLPAEGGAEAVRVPLVDAVVSNPPYIRFETMGPGRRSAAAALQRDQAAGLSIPSLSGKSDQYVYFLIHATAFLKDGGRLGYIISSSWLDTTYGLGLQKFVLGHYRVEAIIESQAERWFVDSDTNTCILLLTREKNEDRRDSNIVRFVQLRQPLTQLLGDPVTDAERRDAFERIIDDIVESPAVDDVRWRIRLKEQGTLARTSGDGEIGESDDETQDD